MSITKSVAVFLGSAIIIVAFAVGTYLLGWWVEEDTINRRSEINNDSYARQTALQEEMVDKYRTVSDIDVQIATATDEQVAPLKAQRQAVLNQLCLAHSQWTGTVSVPQHVTDYAERNCA